MNDIKLEVQKSMKNGNIQLKNNQVSFTRSDDVTEAEILLTKDNDDGEVARGIHKDNFINLVAEAGRRITTLDVETALPRGESTRAEPQGSGTNAIVPFETVKSYSVNHFCYHKLVLNKIPPVRE